MKDLGGILIVILVLLLAVSFIFGSYWVAKNVSYWLFYEDMVRQTITEMVDKGSLL